MRFFNYTNQTDDRVRRDRTVYLVLAILWVALLTFNLIERGDAFWTFIIIGLGVAFFAVNFVGAQLEIARREAAFHERNAQMRRDREDTVLTQQASPEPERPASELA